MTDKYNTSDSDNEAVESGKSVMSSSDNRDPEYDLGEGGAYYEIEDDDKEPKNEGPKKSGFVELFRLMIRLLISPRVGWKEIRRRHLSGDLTCRFLLYPLIGLASVVNFINLWYDPELTVTDEVIKAVVTFASLFFAYFLVFPSGRLLLKGKGAEVISTEFGKTFVAFAMSTLSLFYVCYTLFPMLEPIMVMLPLWTIYAITRGIKILRIPERDETSATVWLSILIVGLPVVVGYIFGIMLRH